jgi:hypothetical protein
MRRITCTGTIFWFEVKGECYASGYVLTGGGIKRAPGRCGIPTWEAKSETVGPTSMLVGKIQQRHNKVKSFLIFSSTNLRTFFGGNNFIEQNHRTKHPKKLPELRVTF